MYELVRFFVDMALLRRGPQELPRSLFLMNLLLAINLAVNVPLAIELFPDPFDALMASLTELLLTAGALLLGLQFSGGLSRWVQSFSALMGLGVLAGVVSIAYRALAALLHLPELVTVFDLLVFLWALVAMAGVVSHAFDMPFPFALFVAFTFSLLVMGFMAGWLGPVSQPHA